MAGENLVEVSNLKKQYGNFTAVDGVSFQIRKGEIFGLLGPNGAGKTSSIHILAGIFPPTSGEVQIAGYDIRKGLNDIKKIIGIVPQELAIYPRLTGQENLEFFGELYGLQGNPLKERVEETLALVGLSERASSRAETYSGGMKRRLNLAAGLMHRPQLLLLDEPTVGVDPQSRNHVFEGVRELNRQGLTVLYTSHYMEEVEALCDRVGIMDAGRLVACDTVPNLIASMGSARIEVGVGKAEAEEKFLNRLRNLEGVRTVEVVHSEEANSLHIGAPRPSEVLPSVISTMNDSALSLLSLQIKQPNLEDVFLSLTGKSLRD